MKQFWAFKNSKISSFPNLEHTVVAIDSQTPPSAVLGGGGQDNISQILLLVLHFRYKLVKHTAHHTSFSDTASYLVCLYRVFLLKHHPNYNSICKLW
jgi:hypothetical protein